MKAGIYGGLARKDLPDGLSPSGAKTLLFRSPAQYQWERQHPSKPTRNMTLGTLVHALILEGKSRYAVVLDRRTKAGKDAANDAIEEGLEVVNPAEAHLIEGMTAAVLEHETAANILADGEPERAVIWSDVETDTTCRGFIDWLRPNAIIDLKTTDDASPSGFARQAANLHYDLQAEFYRAGVEAITGERLPFLLIAVESKPPHLVAVHHFPPEAEERGRFDMRRAIDLYQQCTETGEWPAYGTEIISTPWPRWAN